MADLPHPPQVPAHLTEHAGHHDLVDEDEFDGDHIQGVEWSDTSVSDVVIRECRIERASLTGSELRRFKLTDVTFLDCELSGVVFEHLRASRVEFRLCRMAGVVMTNAVLADVAFNECRLDEANFRMTAAERCGFFDTRLGGADFYDADFRGGHFLRCDLKGVEFSKARLAGARLHGSDLTDVRGAVALAGATIGSTQSIPLGVLLLHELGIVVDDGDVDDD